MFGEINEPTMTLLYKWSKQFTEEAAITVCTCTFSHASWNGSVGYSLTTVNMQEIRPVTSLRIIQSMCVPGQS
jgi:hypothetical protein